MMRNKVLNLYKNLLYYGRDYPSGYDYFKTRLRKSFLKNANVKDEQEIEKLISRGDYVIKEIDALYKLKKYRTLKRLYYDEDNDEIGRLYKSIDTNSGGSLQHDKK